MKILFLDDDKNRTSKFKQRMIGHEVVCVETPEEAFEALDWHSRFDIASLDHDLYGKVYQPSDDKSGFAVCEFLQTFDADKLPDLVVCHSYNEDGVKNMMAALSDIVRHTAEPFDADTYWAHFPMREVVTV